jgi:hypothetical protein
MRRLSRLVHMGDDGDDWKRKREAVWRSGSGQESQN